MQFHEGGSRLPCSSRECAARSRDASGVHDLTVDGRAGVPGESRALDPGRPQDRLSTAIDGAIRTMNCRALHRCPRIRFEKRSGTGRDLYQALAHGTIRLSELQVGRAVVQANWLRILRRRIDDIEQSGPFIRCSWPGSTSSAKYSVIASRRARRRSSPLTTPSRAALHTRGAAPPARAFRGEIFRHVFADFRPLNARPAPRSHFLDDPTRPFPAERAFRSAQNAVPH